MHLAVKRDVVNHFAAVCLERRAKVVNVHAGKLRHQPVRATGRNPPHDEVVNTLFSPSTDHVVALFKLRKEIWDLGRVVLQVAIHRENVVTLRMIKACGKRRGLTKIAAQFYDQHAAVDCGDLFHQFVGAVA